MAKIQLNDSLPSIVSKMSDGNPGAMSAIMDLVTNSEKNRS